MNLRVYGDTHLDARPLFSAANPQRPTERLHTLAHAAQAESCASDARWVKTMAIVVNRQLRILALDAGANRHFSRHAMARDVGQRLLRDTKQFLLRIQRQGQVVRHFKLDADARQLRPITTEFAKRHTQTSTAERDGAQRANDGCELLLCLASEPL